MKTCFLFLTQLFLFSAYCFAQTPKIDSLKTECRHASTQAQRLQVLFALCEQRNSLHADSLYHFASEAKQLAATMNDRPGALLADYYLATSLEKKGLFDTTYQIVEEKLKATRARGSMDLARRKLLYLKGSLLVRKNMFKEAHAVFFDLLNQAERSGDTVNLIAAQHAIGWVYMESNQPKEALEWFYKAIRTSSDRKYEQYYSGTYGNMIAVYGMMEQYDSVQRYIQLGTEAARRHQQLGILCNVLNLKASLYMMTGRNPLAEEPLREALAIRKQIGDPFYVVADMAQLSGYYSNAGNSEKALAYSKEGIALAEKYQITSKLPILYHALAHAYQVKGDLTGYSAAIEKHIAINDSLYKVNTARAMAELETKYQVQKQENTIILQDIALLRRTYQVIALVILVVVLGLAGFLFFTSYRRKQRMQLNRLLEEEKIASAKAVRDAEETERRRIAADLHDNLGAYAAAIAHNLEHVIQNIGDGTPALQQLRNNSQAMVSELSDTIWALKKDALRLTAISDRVKIFAQKLQESYRLTIDVEERIEEDTLLPPSQAFHLLRIIQEAITNAVKHSGGDRVVVTVVSASAWKVIVSDNGRGMPEVGRVSEGNGLVNMVRRAELSGWQLSWQKGQNGGTELVIGYTTN